MNRNAIKCELLEEFLSLGILLDADEEDIEDADFNSHSPGWSWKGFPWLEGSLPVSNPMSCDTPRGSSPFTFHKNR